MSLTDGLITGWMPSCGDDDVDISSTTYPVKVPPALSCTSSIDSYSQYPQSSDYPPSSPDSSVDYTDDSHTDLPSTSSLSSSDRRAIRNRLRDPEWVPRPRNAFIIFRCEYSRKHARGPGDSSDRSSRCDKTVSKRAGEEWRRLSAAERERYKLLAEQEKVIHALQNPDYRFKPTRRPPPGLSSHSARAHAGAGRRNDRSTRVASFIERRASSPTRDTSQGVDAKLGSGGIQPRPPLLACSAGAVLPQCLIQLLRGRRPRGPPSPDPSHAHRVQVQLLSISTRSRAAR
jgi:hypothetical protein